MNNAKKQRKTIEWERKLETKETFRARMGMIKDRKTKDVTETEEIKKRWQKYTEELYKKDPNNPNNHDNVDTYLEPDILECEVK